LCAVIVCRLKLPSGGRGTDRDRGDAEDILPPDRAIGLLDGSAIDLKPPCGGRGMLRFIAICVVSERAGSEVTPRPKNPRLDMAAGLLFPRLCGGRGTKRPPGAGMEVALVVRPAGVRPAGWVVLRAPGFPRAREAVAAGLDEIAGGVILLKVGREAVDRDGWAAGEPVFGPSLVSRVGDTSGLPIEEMLRKAPGEILAAFWATGSPRSRVFRETAVSAPGRLA